MFPGDRLCSWLTCREIYVPVKCLTNLRFVFNWLKVCSEANVSYICRIVLLIKCSSLHMFNNQSCVVLISRFHCTLPFPIHWELLMRTIYMFIELIHQVIHTSSVWLGPKWSFTFNHDTFSTDIYLWLLFSSSLGSPSREISPIQRGCHKEERLTFHPFKPGFNPLQLAGLKSL